MSWFSETYKELSEFLPEDISKLELERLRIFGIGVHERFAMFTRSKGHFDVANKAASRAEYLRSFGMHLEIAIKEENPFRKAIDTYCNEYL